MCWGHFCSSYEQGFKGFDGFAESFIDDIGIYSNSWIEHLEHLRIVFQALRDANLSAKPSKCCFGYPELTFLGHVVSNGIIKPTVDKLENIKSFPVPKTKKQVRSFMGLIGFYRKFIPEFSNIAAPITDLTKKSMPKHIKWSENLQSHFDKLKQVLLSKPVLRSPDFSKGFYLRTDACDTGVGAVLEQEFDDGRHPVMYLSKKFSGPECNYSVIEKECYAIVWAVKLLRQYLEGVEFCIESDHQPLTWLQRVKMTNQRLLRWSLILQEFKYSVAYVRGKCNVVADYLSRLDC